MQLEVIMVRDLGDEIGDHLEFDVLILVAQLGHHFNELLSGLSVGFVQSEPSLKYYITAILHLSPEVGPGKMYATIHPRAFAMPRLFVASPIVDTLAGLIT